MVLLVKVKVADQMRVTFDSGIKKDLTGKEITLLDTTLRKNIPELIEWTYSPLTGELTLDFGDADENALSNKIQSCMKKTNCVKLLRLEFMEFVKEWEK